jgi:homoserine O-acetyltransferase
MPSIGRVQTRFATFDEGMDLRNGHRLAPLTLAYEIYGELNEQRSNAVLVFHALTGSQHAAGINVEVPGLGEEWNEEVHTGWWDSFIGPGKALDTNELAVICANYVGSCYGSTGPSATNPATGKAYGSAFPRIDLTDVVDSQVALLDHLGIERLHAVIGGSVGGLMALSLATRYPDRVDVVVPIAAGLGVTALQRIHNFEQSLAIENDPNFDDVLITNPLESYMWHQGTKFVQRFDANSYLHIMELWQTFDLLAQAGVDDLNELLKRCRGQRFMVFSIDSDVCFYPDEQEELAAALKKAGVPVRRITVHSDRGHDAFLLEPELFTPHLRDSLRMA